MMMLAAAAALISTASAASGKGSFPSSQLITAEHGTKLNSWANMSAGQEWRLCYTSFTMDKTPAEFHKRCDDYYPTITVAHTYNRTQTGECQGYCINGGADTACSPIGPDICGSGDEKYPCIGFCDNEELTMCQTQKIGSPCGRTEPGNLTFGGFADDTWSGTGIKKGTNASFIFTLGPAEPELFRPANGAHGLNCVDGTCMFVNTTLWPQWGSGPDLAMGENGPPGLHGMCDQETYIGSGELCGGDADHGGWGETNLEVWRLVGPPQPPTTAFPTTQSPTRAPTSPTTPMTCLRALLKSCGGTYKQCMADAKQYRKFLQDADCTKHEIHLWCKSPRF